MEYTLMHKNMPVADMVIDSEIGVISKLAKIHNERHLPIGVQVFKTGIDRKALNDWWCGRCIPASRAGIDAALQNIGISAPTFLLEKCYGLSLSDHYWISPEGSGLCWENVNFFTNGFSKDMGDILFGHEPDAHDRVSLMSPDNTSDGWLRKKWIISDGKRYLMKGGSGDYSQEPYNEVIASEIMCRLEISHITYTLTIESGKPYSLCENFVTPETELVPTWRVVESMKKSNQDSAYTHLLRCCDKLGIADTPLAIDRMLIVDYIISNEDRHYNNFGFVRNAETLEWLGFAPIFDSGTSLWYNTVRIGSSVKSKPFKKSHTEQISLVTDLSWFNTDVLKDIEREISEIFSHSIVIDKARCNAIIAEVQKRIETVK